MNKQAKITAMLLVLALCAVTQADELLVPAEYPTIQAAIYYCNDGDTVIIDPNTYTGPGNRDIDFLGKAITVRSTNPNDPNVVAATIIDCDASVADPHHGFTLYSGEGPNSIINGLTITNGYGKMVPASCHVFALGGGGIFCYGSSPQIINCVIKNNSAVVGGGICCSCGSGPTITNCSITGNTAVLGGGVSCYGASATITYCEINNNSAEGFSPAPASGDGGSACGGGVFIGYNSNNNNTTVQNCVVAGNTVVAGNGGWGYWLDPGNGGNGDGGGISCHGGAKIENCTIVGNTVSGGYGGFEFGDGGDGYGGGVSVSCWYEDEVRIRNCTVTNNAVSRGRGEVDGEAYGAGIYSMPG